MAEEDISIVKVRDVLLVTLPSSPSDRVIDKLQDKVLTKMADYNMKKVIIDIKLVEVVDSFFARLIEETAQMISLMGGTTVISGMQPSVAVTATELGLSFGGTKTALSVESALNLLSETKSLDNGKT